MRTTFPFCEWILFQMNFILKRFIKNARSSKSRFQLSCLTLKNVFKNTGTNKLKKFIVTEFKIR